MMENSGFRSSPDRGGRESVIDQDCYFEGTFRTPGNMRIEGTYQGAIECRGTLLVAESGNVNARILAGSLIIAGQYTGEAQCESRFELLKTGKASGTVAAKSIVIHEGAFFQGEIRMGAGESVSRERPTLPMAAGTTPSSGGMPSGSGSSASGQPSGSSRRRPAPEAAPEAADGGPVGDDLDAPPHTNGRAQATTGRDVMPNRTGEEHGSGRE